MTVPNHQQIEEAYKATSEVIARIPENTETKRALHHLEIAEQLTYEARERTQPCTDD